MFCTNCGAPVEPGQKFCNKCGTPVNAADVNVKGFVPPVQSQAQPKKKKTALIVVIILAVILCLSVLGGVLAYRAYHAVRNYMIDNGLADVPYIDDPDDYDAYDYYEDLTDGDLDAIEDEFEDYLEGDTDPGTGADGFGSGSTGGTIEEIFGDLHESAVTYGYADVYVNEDAVLIDPNGTVNDDTVIWNGKTLGGFCDYVDSDVFGGNRPMNRDMLYKLISIHMIDPLLVPDDETFETVMKYCLLVAAEFRDSGAVMNKGGFTSENPNKYYYEMEVNGQTQTWMIDYNTQEVTLNNGKTQYSSAGEYGLFTEQSMVIWMVALSEYFGLE
ncbi:zinc-ribbon domain-containing protein [Butyrivibrio sp. NC2007]|uniref:zinc-ribbon domain-containing protein n=1 Tax=Butyrivibrio sp. NC2007 TaxID=1280683 RepID=UPI0003B7A37E|nr:zinc-ribbon domain-containing protein [Butyrivibrio sp. NC2007]